MNEYTHHVPPPCDEAVDIVHSDDHILVVSKPSGLLSVPGRFVKDCVLHRVQFDFPDVRIVHRLDLDTSGLLVLALSKLAVSDLNRQFRERVIRKVYLARVDGLMEQDTGEIDLPMRPDPDDRPRQVIDHEQGKSALTRFKVISREGDSTLVKLMPVTGRSHQLRLHMAAIGHPILGCDLYAPEDVLARSERLCLHAAELGLTHPESGESLHFEKTISL